MIRGWPMSPRPYGRRSSPGPPRPTIRSGCPRSSRGCPTATRAHHCLVDDFARAVVDGMQPAVNAWQAARYTLPGVIAHQSMRNGGERLPIHDLGDCPLPVQDLDAAQAPLDIAALEQLLES